MTANSLQAWMIEQLDGGHLAVGMKLPAERELASRFGLSRGSVRGVLSGFVESGLLRRSTGSGTYVAALPHRTRRERQHRLAVANVSPAELMQARLMFEPLLPALIVRHATPEDFERMAFCVAESERAGSVEEFEYWDGALHEALALATHNAFFVLTQRNVSEARESGDWGQLKHATLTDARREHYERQHRALVEALRARDATRAAALLREHLEEIERHLFDA